MRLNRLPFVLAALAVTLAGCTSPTDSSLLDPLPSDNDDVTQQAVKGGGGSSGGQVKNSAPTVRSFTSDRTTGDNSGSFTVVFSGTVFDPNAEAQIASIAVASATLPGLSVVHAVAPTERVATTEPASYGADGFKVWSGALNDGVLEFRYRVTFPAFTEAGDHGFGATVADLPGLTASSSSLTITLTKFSLISVASAPVDIDGDALTGASWGGWEAEGSAEGVAATNFIKLTNDGDSANPILVLDFTETGFVGVDDANFSIPIDANIEFAWFEDTTPLTTSPAEGTLTYGGASATGSVQLRFTGAGNVIYVTYRIVSMPEVLPVQSYGASFTVTELA